jgi:5'/3'-nucleotidase SurE
VRVLLTNDDGVRSAGISAIRAALTGVCTSVVTVAPAADCSGFARKGTFDRPVVVQRLEGGPHPVYECDGTPTDCVRAGLLGGLAAGTDLVVSGINHGANVADDVVYSGTAGAALEAAVLGTSALCLSQQSLAPQSLSPESVSPEYFDFSLAARYGAGLAAAIAQAGPQSLYPFGEPDEVIPEAGGQPDTDLAALRRGLISVTPLSVAIGLDEVSPAMTSFLARLPVSARWPGHPL